MAPFADISITGLNKTACRDIDGSTFEMHLVLSDRPQPEWCRFFHDSWEEQYYRTNRNVQILEHEIIIQCSPDELQQDQIHFLKHSIKSANQKFRDLLAQRMRAYQETMALKAEQRQRLDQIANTLDLS